MAALVTLWVAFAILCAYIADRRNAGVGRWFVFGLLFGVFALIALLATTTTQDIPKSRP
jgi:peptidoglycan/LPS O-acetylase OafA/YrhL